MMVRCVALVSVVERPSRANCQCLSGKAFKGSGKKHLADTDVDYAVRLKTKKLMSTRS